MGCDACLPWDVNLVVLTGFLCLHNPKFLKAWRSILIVSIVFNMFFEQVSPILIISLIPLPLLLVAWNLIVTEQPIPVLRKRFRFVPKALQKVEALFYAQRLLQDGYTRVGHRKIFSIYGYSNWCCGQSTQTTQIHFCFQALMDLTL
jgi:hypothetical protein